MSNQLEQDEEPWHRPEDLARIFDVDVRDILAVIESGELAAVNFTGRWRVSSASVEKYLCAKSNHRSRRRLERFRAMAVGVALLTVGLATSLLYAQTSGSVTSAIVPYRGYLESSGIGVDGARSLDVCLYRSAESSECIWNELHSGVNIVAGHFAIQLGSQTSLDDVLSEGGNLFLGLTVDGVELAGRQLLGSSPFALGGAPGRDFRIDGTVHAASATLDGELTASSVVVAGTTSTQALAVAATVNVGNGIEAAAVVSRGGVQAAGEIHGSGGRADCGAPRIEFSDCRGFASVFSACNFQVCDACGCGELNPGVERTQIIRAAPGR